MRHSLDDSPPIPSATTARTRSASPFRDNFETDYPARDDSPRRKRTARGFDSLLLSSIVAFTPARIQALRARESISQAVLALHLNVPRKLVSDWERGIKQPSGPTLKLLSLIWHKGIAHIA